MVDIILEHGYRALVANILERNSITEVHHTRRKTIGMRK